MKVLNSIWLFKYVAGFKSAEGVPGCSAYSEMKP